MFLIVFVPFGCEAGSVRCQKIVEKFGMSLGSFLTYKIVFFGLPGVSKKTQILKRFWHSFCDDFARPGNVKNEQKKLVLGSFLGAFWLSCGVLTAKRSESNTRVLYSRPGKPDLRDLGKFWKILGSVLGAF